ncbi:MAG TPA: transporter substrate-binding domain-containing protein [Deltaproteobacteria bacterium]|nr:transporter substrate-binding domain-containing protein [Deltaproteobacteria bacterium]
MKTIRAAALLMFFVLPQCLLAQDLTVSYMNRPPYYYTEDGTARGFLVELTKKILDDAGIDVTFRELPPNRIMHEIQKRDHAHCSIGWFRTPEREQFAKFSLPIYRNRPIVVVTTRENNYLFTGYSTLHQLFTDRSLVMGNISSFTYGSYIDRLMKDLRPATHEISTSRGTLPALIKKKRVHYLLSAPEEVETLIHGEGLRSEDFMTIVMSDIPEGNKRYLMFSMSVSDDTITRINASMVKIKGSGLSEDSSR